MASPPRHRPAFLDRLAQLPRRPATAEIARNLSFLFNTRKACGSVLPSLGLGDYEGESNTLRAVEALRLELLSSVREHEPRLREAQVRLLGRHRYNLVRFELTGRVGEQACALQLDMDTTTRHVQVTVAEATSR